MLLESALTSLNAQPEELDSREGSAVEATHPAAFSLDAACIIIPSIFRSLLSSGTSSEGDTNVVFGAVVHVMFRCGCLFEASV